MRVYGVLVSLTILVYGIVVAMPQTVNDDPYSIAAVKALLKQPLGFSSGSSEKQLYRLGDKASIALLKIYDDKDLRDPSNARLFLPLLRNAFAYPKLISIPEDRMPRVTVLLLGHLEAQVSDVSLRQEIARTLKVIQNETAK